MTFPSCAVAAALVVSTITVVFAQPQMKLNPGPIAGKEVHLPNARNYAYCEIAPVIGKGPQAVAQFYNTSQAGDCPPDKFSALDAKKLAAELHSDLVYLNPTPQSARRHWVMDQLWAFVAGETVDFHGVKAIWVAAMTPEDMTGLLKGPFTPGQIQRASKYLYAAGSAVFLLRQPDGKAWVMQSYATEVDAALTFETLSQIGTRLALPEGWRFETKTLTSDLTIDPRKAPESKAHIIRDNLHNVYEGCGFDAACSYLP
jgi:hypothetical protein